MRATYILPIRRDRVDPESDLAAYLASLPDDLEVIVVDGSPPAVFEQHAALWGGQIRHIAPDPDLITPNGKVGGVLTGVRHATNEHLVIADDDVRYTPDALRGVIDLLDEVHVVRPQNYFDPLPWHARWDTARSLLNRMTGGDWPGTLAVRRSVLQATGGYDGAVLFENLELVRTVRAAGGRECVPLDLFVRRLPPDSHHFWSQRVRQAYDEFARPLRLGVWLSLLPLCLLLALRGPRRLLLAALLGPIALAEAGRWRSGGQAVFPVTATLLAPAWVGERAVCAWLAVGTRLFVGGVRYRGGILRQAATPPRTLRERHAAVRARIQAMSASTEPEHAPGRRERVSA